MTQVTAASGMANGKLADQLGFGDIGCAYRGSLFCLACPYADRIAKECDWQCYQCNDRWRCFCGQTGQEHRVDSAMASTALESHCSVVASDAACTTRATAASRSATATDNVGAVARGRAERGA